MSQEARSLSREDSPLLQALEEQLSPALRERMLGLGHLRIPDAYWDEALLGPLLSFAARGGKSLRTELMQCAYSVVSGKGTLSPALTHAVELLHAGSLIVDDIEDGSLERRGGPSLHVAYGIPRALNVGNTLYFLAEEQLSNAGLSPAAELRARRVLSRTMVRAHHGQALDVSIPITSVPQPDVFRVVATVTRLKTGALLELATALAGISAGAEDEVLQTLATMSAELGTALQALDDLGCILKGPRRKKGVEDLLAQRPTWVMAWASTMLSDADYGVLVRSILSLGQRPGRATEVLDDLAEVVEERGREEVKQHLSRALFLVSSLSPEQSAFLTLRRLLDRLSTSYG